MKKQYSVLEQSDQHTAALTELAKLLPFLASAKYGVRDFIGGNNQLSVRAEAYPFGKEKNFYVEYLTPAKSLSKAYKAAKKGLDYICHLMQQQYLFLFYCQAYVDAIETVRDGETLKIAALNRNIEQVDGRKSVGWAVPQAWMIETVPCRAAINIYRQQDIDALEVFLVNGCDTTLFDYTEGCLRTKAMDKELNRAGIYLPKPEPAKKEPKAVKPSQPSLMELLG